MFKPTGLLFYMKTIGYFGDSFCVSKKRDSWCVLLAQKLDLEIVHWGTGGASIWNTMLEFNNTTAKPDVIIFCWTNPNRLYHPTLPLTPNAVPIPAEDPQVFAAAESYYKYLQNDEKDKLASRYALQWFDQNELKPYEDSHKIIQMWSFKPFETANKDAGIKLSSGTFIDESMFAFSKSAGEKDGWGVGTINHMTVEQNQQWADKVYSSMH